MAVGSIHEIQITGLSHDGQGVGRLGDQVVFVPGLLATERARIRLVHRSRRHWNGQRLELLQPSPLRRQPPCILAERCGGCSLQHLTPQGQIQAKQQQLADAMARIGHLAVPAQPLMASDRELGYRNRAIIPLERSDDGRIRAGYYERGSHSIINLNRCPVLDPRIDALIEPIKLDLQDTDWPVDRHLSQDGGLRHLALRVGHHSDELLITLVSSHDDLPGLQELADHWMQRWPSLVGVLLNLQDRPNNTLFGPQTQLISGREWLVEHFSGLTLHLGADTFFQVNTAQAERVVPLLLAACGEALASHPLEIVDAYCGVGTFSLPLAAAGHHVVGLELHPSAVLLAERNALINGLESRARFETGSVAANLAAVLPRSDVLLVDPPRKGLESFVLQTVLEHPPRTLLYLSCDPATLARDLGRLVGAGGYTLESLQPLDFFANTSHVETLAVLRQSP